MKDALFRELRPRDVVWILSDEARQILFPYFSYEEYKRLMEKYLFEDTVELFVCLVHDVSVGILAVQRGKWDKDNSIIRIAVREDYRLRGVGKFMINQLIDFYRDYECFFRLFTSHVDDKTVGFFRKCGFGEIEYGASDCSGNQWTEYRCFIDI